MIRFALITNKTLKDLLKFDVDYHYSLKFTIQYFLFLPIQCDWTPVKLTDPSP